MTKVFAGRGTVSLSLQLQLGERPPQQLLWRRLGDESFARLHLDTQIEPVAIDSSAESRLLLGIANWLALRLGDREALWRPEPTDLATTSAWCCVRIEATSRPPRRDFVAPARSWTRAIVLEDVHDQ